MAIRGEFSSEDRGDFNYEVTRYWTEARDAPYTRGASFDKFNSASFQRATVYVSPKDDPAAGFYATVWGPYMDEDLLLQDLEYFIDEGDYGEA
jgi:hypothetical protein